MANVLSHKGNENHNNSEILPYKDKLICQHMLESIWSKRNTPCQHMLESMWSKRNTPSLLEGVPLKEGKEQLTETSCPS